MDSRNKSLDRRVGGGFLHGKMVGVLGEADFFGGWWSMVSVLILCIIIIIVVIIMFIMYVGGFEIQRNYSKKCSKNNAIFKCMHHQRQEG